MDKHADRYYMILHDFIIGEFFFISHRFGSVPARNKMASAKPTSEVFAIFPRAVLSPAPPRVVSCDHCSSQVLVPVLHVVLMMVRVMRVGRRG